MTSAEFHIARKKLGLTQQQLADALGYKLRQISAFERGEKPIPKYVELALVGLRVMKGVVDKSLTDIVTSDNAKS